MVKANMNISRILSLAAASIAVCACFCMRCAHDDNPYGDPSNARAVVSSASFADRDTVNIFTTETLQTMIAVRELVDSVTVIAENNRLGPDTMVIRHPANAGPNTCLISFSDTGWTTILVSTFRKNSEKISTEYLIYCRSPLSQPDIRGNYGAGISLHAGTIGDRDVLYHWDFGNGIAITSPVPDTSAVIKFTVYDTIGSVWVSDPDGRHPSPKTGFSYFLKDNAGPRIVCVNPSYSNSDTILTGDTTFYLRLKISDPAQTLPVYSTQVNSDTFRIREDPYYIQIFSHMDKIVQFIPVVVSAMDNQHFQNISRDTFFLRFSDTMSHSNSLLFTMKDPATDSSVSKVSVKGILGQLEDYAHDSISVVVKMRFNGVPKTPPDTVPVKLSGKCNFLCTLSVGINKIGLVAYSMNGDSLAAKTIQILYDPSIIDTAPPVILEITVDGRDADNYFTPRNSALVKIIAFDEASGIKAMQINGGTVPAAPDGHGFIWRDTVMLTHTPAGNTFTVSAMDNDSNVTKRSFTLYKNSAPVVTHTPSFAGKVYAGSAYSDNLVCQDNDNDTVTVAKVSGPSSVSVFRGGRIDWKPLPADTGEQTVILSLFDGYEYVPFSFHATVIGDTTNMPPRVRFATVVEDFPAFLEVGRDSLEMSLKTYSASGNAPLLFSAALLNRTPGGTIIMRDSVLSWRPALADTGTQTLVLIVNDRFRRSDTLRPVIAVVPPNRPCSLFVSSTIPKFKDGELDLSNTTMPETLFFSVHDPDPFFTERLTAIVRWPTSKSVIGIDSSRQFILILKPKTSSAQKKDTVTVVVKDNAGHADSLVFFIAYTPPFDGTLVINTSPTGVQITQNVLNFPLLVRLDKSFFPFESAPNRGRDVRFRKSDGTACPYEIESWDSAAGTAAMWVLMDTIFANNTTQNVQISWGNTSGIDGSNGHAVFDTAKGFLGVWHLNEPSGDVSDATFHMLSGVDAGTPTGTSGITGIIGNARAFDPAKKNMINLGSSPIICGLRDSITVSAWYKAILPEDTLVSVLRCNDNFTALQINQKGEGFTTFWNTTERAVPYPWAGKYDDGLWHYVTAKYKRGSGCRVFTDGIMVAADSTNTGALAVSVMPEFLLGSSGNTEYFNGALDEVRVEKSYRSPDWIKLSYENQRPGSTVVTFK
jgi:hypothetical protein